MLIYWSVNKPVEEFTGKVIAIIRRLKDVEDKWGCVTRK